MKPPERAVEIRPNGVIACSACGRHIGNVRGDTVKFADVRWRLDPTETVEGPNGGPVLVYHHNRRGGMRKLLRDGAWAVTPYLVTGIRCPNKSCNAPQRLAL